MIPWHAPSRRAMVIRSVLWIVFLALLVEFLFTMLGTGSGSSGVGNIHH